MKDIPRTFFYLLLNFPLKGEKVLLALSRSSLHYPPQSKKGGGGEGKGCGVFCLGRFFVVVDSLNTGQLVLGACVSVYQENMADAICSRKQNGRVHL